MRQEIGFLFPGQGSQYVGMGRDLFDQFPAAKRIFEQVDEICQRPISKLSFEGPMDDLTLTQNLQPAVTAVNLACLAALEESGVQAAVSAGHSLGEYAALVSSGVIGSYDALRLVQKRGELMHREALANPGAMAAVVGMDYAAVEEAVNEAKGEGVLSVANHNTAEQIVITGEQEPLARAVQLIKSKGAKAIPLKVSGAWHCKLMEGAVEEFQRFMEDIPFSAPRSKILFNVTAAEEHDPEKIKAIMAEQLVSPVKWFDIMQAMTRDGVRAFVEAGPKKVLSGLAKKIIPSDSDVKIHNVEDHKSLKDFLDQI